jgi:hypothetical protein
MKCGAIHNSVNPDNPYCKACKIEIERNEAQIEESRARTRSLNSANMGDSFREIILRIYDILDNHQENLLSTFKRIDEVDEKIGNIDKIELRAR